MSDGINKGFLKGKGDWVMWLNTDDYLLPGALAKVAAWTERHPEADVVYGGYHLVDSQKRITRTIKLFPFDLRMLIHHECFIGSTACFLRKATTIDQGFFLNKHFRYVMDGEYYARLGRAAKCFSYLPEVLACFRIHGQNLSQRYLGATSIDDLLRLHKQQAEALTIRRAYGWTFFKSPINNNVADAFFWWLYRLKRIAKKLRWRSYWAIPASGLFANSLLT